MFKLIAKILVLSMLLAGCAGSGTAKQSSKPSAENAKEPNAQADTSAYNDYGETPFIAAIKDQDINKILSLLNSGRADITKPDMDGVPPVLVAIKIGLDLDTLEAILQKTPLAPGDILDKRTKNAYDYVKDYRNNNASYLMLLDKYQNLRG